MMGWFWEGGIERPVLVCFFEMLDAGWVVPLIGEGAAFCLGRTGCWLWRMVIP